MTLDMSQHRQALRIPPRGAAPRHQGRAALDQPLGRRRSRCIATARIHLCAGGPQGRWRAGGRAASSWPRGDGPFRTSRDFARRINPRAVNKRTLESLIAAGALDEIEPDRARAHCGARRHAGARQPLAGRTRPPGRPTSSAPAGSSSRCACRLSALARRRAAAARIRGDRLLPHRPSARRVRRTCSNGCACSAGPISPRR